MRYPAIAGLLVLVSCVANHDLSEYARGESGAPAGGATASGDTGGSGAAGAGGQVGSSGAQSEGAAGASGADASSVDPSNPVDGAGAGGEGAGGASGGGAGGDGSTPPPPASGVDAIEPPDGASGVASDAVIVITFAEAMDVASVEAAYRSDELLPEQVAFDWSSDARVLTITPASGLRLASGTDPARVSAARFAYGFVEGARTASGAALPSFEVSFTTLREITAALGPVPDNALTGNWRSDGVYGSFTCAETGNQICVGDGSVAANAFYRALLSFDLAAIPAAAEALSQARLQLGVVGVSGQPFATLGALELEHLDFEAIGPGAFEAAPLAALGVLATAAAAGSNLSADVLDVVQGDLLDDGMSQFRVRFQVGTDSDDTPDFVTLARNGPRLAVTYLVP